MEEFCSISIISKWFIWYDHSFVFKNAHNMAIIGSVSLVILYCGLIVCFVTQIILSIVFNIFSRSAFSAKHQFFISGPHELCWFVSWILVQGSMSASSLSQNLILSTQIIPNKMFPEKCPTNSQLKVRPWLEVWRRLSNKTWLYSRTVSYRSRLWLCLLCFYSVAVLTVLLPVLLCDCHSFVAVLSEISTMFCP